MNANESKIDRRHVELEVADIRVEVREDGTRMIRGLAAPFESESVDMGFVETIAPGAFTGAIERSDVRALFNHDPDNLLGRTTNGTLRIWESDRGLEYEVEPPDTQLARDLEKLIERRDITGNSFAFTVADGGDTYQTEDGRMHRTITEVEQLFDVGPVVYPAYADTVVSMRAANAALAAENEPAARAEIARRIRKYRKFRYDNV